MSGQTKIVSHFPTKTRSTRTRAKEAEKVDHSTVVDVTQSPLTNKEVGSTLEKPIPTEKPGTGGEDDVEPLSVRDIRQPTEAGTGGEDDVDFSTCDISQHIKEDVSEAVNKDRDEPVPVYVTDEEVRKFLKKAKVTFLGQTEGKQLSPPKKRRVLRKENVFTNDTDKMATFTFHKNVQDITTAQLSTMKGFKIGMAALVGGGVGAQGSVAMGAGYSKQTERMEQSSHTSDKGMKVEVQVARRGSIVAVETDYSSVYEAECDFDIAVKDDYEIEYSFESEPPRKRKRGLIRRAKDLLTSSKKPKIGIALLRRDGDDESGDDELLEPTAVEQKNKEKDKKLVHLHRSCSCKVVTIEHELTIEQCQTDKGKSKQT